MNSTGRLTPEAKKRALLAIETDQKSMTASASVPMSGHYGTETTKMKNVTEPELRVGDSIHFDYTEKDGEMWLTELSRTHKPRS